MEKRELYDKFEELSQKFDVYVGQKWKQLKANFLRDSG